MVRTIAQVVQEALDKPRNIQFKGVTDLVTDTDRASEEAILKVVIPFSARLCIQCTAQQAWLEMACRCTRMCTRLVRAQQRLVNS